jgi:hypothetical protein
MRNHLLVFGLAAVFAACLAAPAAAQDDNVSGIGASEGADGTIFQTMSATTNYFATHRQCTDPTLTSTTISGAVADCCIAGDIWRVTVAKKKALAHAGNVGAAAGSAAFAPDVYSANATIVTSVKKVDVYTTSGNNTPGGIPAGLTTRYITNGGGPVCSTRATVGGTVP